MTGQYAERGCGPELLGWLAMAGRRHHHGRGRHRGGPWSGGFGFGGPGGPFGRPQRARRGDVRAALLTLLAEEPRNGYQLMQEIERRSEGVWRPSPGSVYPALQQLEDEGLVQSDETGAGKRFLLTDAGREAADKAAAEDAPWDAASESVDSDAWELFGVARQVGMAIFQIAPGRRRRAARLRPRGADQRAPLALRHPRRGRGAAPGGGMTSRGGE